MGEDGINPERTCTIIHYLTRIPNVNILVCEATQISGVQLSREKNNKNNKMGP